MTHWLNHVFIMCVRTTLKVESGLLFAATTLWSPSGGRRGKAVELSEYTKIKSHACADDFRHLIRWLFFGSGHCIFWHWPSVPPWFRKSTPYQFRTPDLYSRSTASKLSLLSGGLTARPNQSIFPLNPNVQSAKNWVLYANHSIR